jgi:hypothetical protein
MLSLRVFTSNSLPSFRGDVIARLITFAVATILICFLSGCSVGLALQETEEPNLDILEIGTSRVNIEKEFGLPFSEGLSASGDKLYLYRYLEGDRAAYGRATLYVFLDVITLCLWEIFGSNIESANGAYVDLAISYDSDERVEQIRRVTAGVDSFGDRVR